MNHSTGKPTRAQQHRFERIRLIGCVACHMRRSGYRPPEIHHLGITGRHGGKRRGHDFTVGLCPWHHRGIASLDDRHRGLTVWDLEVWLGPSLQKHARRFREEFGEDGPLLEYQNKLLGIATPEPEFGLPKIVPRRLAP